MTDTPLVPHSVRLYLVSFLIVGMAMSVLGALLVMGAISLGFGLAAIVPG